MNRVKRSMLVCMLAIALTTLLTATVSEAAGLSGSKWSIVKSPNVGSNGDELKAVAAVSANDVWAVGFSDAAQTLIEHWNGTSWKVVSSPNIGSSQNVLYGVAAVSAKDVWAVGNHGNTHGLGYLTLIEHWNGTSWQVVKSPNPGRHDSLRGVAVVSANDIWAVGGYITSSDTIQTLIEHWNGSNWQVVASPTIAGSNVIGLSSVAAVSASNVWAVGSYTNSHGVEQTLIEHWNGTKWQIVSSPNVAGSDTNSLSSVAAVSATDIWAVGDYSPTSTSPLKTLTEHWNGTKWQIVSSPNVGSNYNFLYSVAAVSASDVWAVGFYFTSSDIDQTLIEHWNGTKWQVVSSPNVPSSNDDLEGVARVPGSSNLWAVGSYFSNSGGSSKTLTEFYG